MSLAVVGVLASGCEEPNTTSYDPVGVAAADAGLLLETVPAEQVASCVGWTKFGAAVGDVTDLARWESAERSERTLADVCAELGRTDPAALAAMHEDWIEVQASFASG